MVSLPFGSVQGNFEGGRVSINPLLVISVCLGEAPTIMNPPPQLGYSQLVGAAKENAMGSLHHSNVASSWRL